jgi:hypothetical protein
MRSIHPCLDGSRNFCGDGTAVKGWSQFRSLIAAEGRAEVEKTESEGASREISSRQWIPEDKAYDHLVKFSLE